MTNDIAAPKRTLGHAISVRFCGHRFLGFYGDENQGRMLMSTIAWPRRINCNRVLVYGDRVSATVSGTVVTKAQHTSVWARSMEQFLASAPLSEWDGHSRYNRGPLIHNLPLRMVINRKTRVMNLRLDQRLPYSQGLGQETTVIQAINSIGI